MICAPFCRRWETQTLAAECGLHRVQLPGPGHWTSHFHPFYPEKIGLYLVNKLQWRKEIYLGWNFGYRWKGQLSWSVGVGCIGFVSELHLLTLSNHRPCYRHFTWKLIIFPVLWKTFHKRKCLDLELFLLWTSSKITVAPQLLILFHNLKFWLINLQTNCGVLLISYIPAVTQLSWHSRVLGVRYLSSQRPDKMDKMLMCAINKPEWRLGKLRDNVQSLFKSREQHSLRNHSFVFLCSKIFSLSTYCLAL